LILFTTYFEIHSQTAPLYLPKEIGNVWISNLYVTDTLGNPIDPPQVIIDSSIKYSGYLGRQTLFIHRRPENTSTGDTLWISSSNQSIFIHQRDFQVDTFFTIDLPDWFEYYRFSTVLGLPYTIYRVDTTVTIPNLGTLPLRFLIRGTRLGSEIITVPAGTFNSIKFKIEFVVQYRVALPPPLPPLFIDLVNIPTYDWLVQNRYIVKSFQEPVYIDSLNLTIPGSLRELVQFRASTNVHHENRLNDFHLYQNYPNPFNGKTTILFELNSKMSIKLDLYSIRGEFIETLLSGEFNSGLHSFEFDAEKFNLSSGIYFCRFTTNNFSRIISMTYIK